ncbi:signal peptidase II [Paludibacterium paludis]|uniref:Lipoprotein signal peptidase n=1 Tax=Paludibacterium paludis TaxID=1225769 RepID=A0A918P5C2_9NEIS|nr:signal peptidase II [Paludibacterium paludis]GGY21441.1 lipoprotein signal peptidase [Paludibacterium paludis]
MPEAASLRRASGRAVWFVLAFVVIVLDQLTKVWVNGSFQYGEVRPVIDGVFNLTLAYNRGAAFSFLADAGGWQRHFFTLFALGVSGWLGWQILRGGFSRLMCCAGAFIIGGALGNMVDRLLHGHVIDFIQIYYGNWYYPAFNVADSFICVGAALMVVDSLRKGKEGG